MTFKVTIVTLILGGLASVVDADRTRLGAVGQRRQQVGQLRVAMLGHEPFHAIAPAPAARFTGD